MKPPHQRNGTGATDRRDLDTLARDKHPPQEPRHPEDEFEAVCGRLESDGRGGQAFALRIAVDGQPRVRDHLTELVGGLIDERDELELRLLDLRVEQMGRC